MPIADLTLYLFAFEADPSTVRLETRVKDFLEKEPRTEKLDGGELDLFFGSDPRADYLLLARQFIAEMKTLNADASTRVQERIKRRMQEPGSPHAFGRVGVSQILRLMPDGVAVSKVLLDLVGRPIRKHLKKSGKQILATKEKLGLVDPLGLSIVLNDSEKIQTADALAHAVRECFTADNEVFENIDFIWISIEAHRVHLSGQRKGFPQILICDWSCDKLDLIGIVSMMEGWAHFNNSSLEHIEHGGDWGPLRSVYEDWPDALDLH